MELTDPKRLQALEASDLMDGLAEEQFDRLTRLASKSLHAPVALISLVDDRRQYFKSHFGLSHLGIDQAETPLTHSYCQNVVTSEKPLIVELASEDQRVKDNLATIELNVASYCGVPLRTKDGQVIGSFCVLDTKERTWSNEDVELLTDLAKVVMTEIDLRISLQRERVLRAQIDEVAGALQTAMLPPTLPTVEGLDLAAVYLPHGEGNTVGGDFYDVFQGRDDRWHVVIGDVCGKGAASARTSIMVRDFLRSAAMRGESPRSALALAHRALLDDGHPYVAVSMISFDLTRDVVEARITLAGQPQVLVTDGDKVSLAGGYGMFIGGELDLPLEHEESIIQLRPGMGLVMFTDGITDIPGAVVEEAEVARELAKASTASAQESVDSVVKMAFEINGEIRNPADDICVVAVNVPK